MDFFNYFENISSFIIKIFCLLKFGVDFVNRIILYGDVIGTLNLNHDDVIGVGEKRAVNLSLKTCHDCF